MTTDTTFAIPVRLDLDAHSPGVGRAVSHLENAVTRQLDDAGIDGGLRHLLKTRVSQINGCAYCVDMHTKDARAAGESEERISGVAVWAETPFFSPQERAAISFVETVARMSTTHVPDDAYEAVAAHWSNDEVAALIGLVIVITAWNTIGVATRMWEPGSYQLSTG